MCAALFIIAFVCGGLLTSNVQAANWAVGAGVGAAPDYEGSDDYIAVPIPYFSLRSDSGRFLDLTGNKLRANLIGSKMWSAGPFLQYIPKRDDVENNRVDKMEDVDAALMLGAFGQVKLGDFHIRLHGAQDVADGNEGFLAQLGAGYTLPVSQTFRMTMEAFSTYADDDYMSAYFDVSRRDANRSGLKRYDADGGIKDVGLALTTSCNPWEHWRFMGIFSYTRLVGDADDSPLVDDVGDPNQFFGGLVVIYQF
jgi:outer membrane protein